MAVRVRALGTVLWHQWTALLPDPPHTCPGDHLGRTPGGAEDRGQSRKVHALEDVSPRVCQAHSLSLSRNYHHQPRQEPEQVLSFTDEGYSIEMTTVVPIEGGWQHRGRFQNQRGLGPK